MICIKSTKYFCKISKRDEKYEETTLRLERFHLMIHMCSLVKSIALANKDKDL